jgi:hypothetical protein
MTETEKELFQLQREANRYIHMCIHTHTHTHTHNSSIPEHFRVDGLRLANRKLKEKELIRLQKSEGLLKAV